MMIKNYLEYYISELHKIMSKQTKMSTSEYKLSTNKQAFSRNWVKLQTKCRRTTVIKYKKLYTTMSHTFMCRKQVAN